MMDLAQRKTLEVGAKISYLNDELASWENASAPGSALPQHFSQIREAIRLLRSLRDKTVDEQVEAGPQKTAMRLLACHRIWEFFRSKFAQRLVPSFKDFLAWTDQFAYDCYQPARALAVKAPPLVFLNGSYTPFITRRGSLFLPETVQRETIEDKEATDAQKSLPFPVIGVPYYQIRHLAELPSVAHEVGHAVEDDLELSEEFQQLFAATLRPDHPRFKYWTAWRREMFADLWGCLSLGPAFLSALADFKYGQDPETDIPLPTSAYPPPWLRLAFSGKVLARLSYDTEAADVLKTYAKSFPVRDEIYVADADELVQQWLTHQFPKIGQLESLLAFSAGQNVRAQRAAGRLTSESPGAIQDEPDMRVLIAAARFAYDRDPEKSMQQRAIIERALRKAVVSDIRKDPDNLDRHTVGRASTLFDLVMGE